MWSNAASVLAIAASLDFLIGDPWGWPHPVQGMGWLIARYGELARKILQSPRCLRVAGIGLGLGLVSGSGLLGWTLIAAARTLHPLAGILSESILLASCFAGRSLRDAATEVLQPLKAGDLGQARVALSHYVGRDTEILAEPEILRAVLETVTENATDGVLAPLFYGLIGAMIPGVGSAPLALAYKAASTLDSMVGYRTPPYTDLGWFSARMDDVLTWVPCRLVVGTIALLSGRPCQVWRLCQRDAPFDPSPNSGWSECAYAAALNVQVGGNNWYQGIARPKPLLGDPIEKITPDHIYRALRLTRSCFLLWLVPMIGVSNWITAR
ncbi:cobalamin biosynthesis protein [Leptolyngbya sp. 'hensonii']|uniref:adenosylcobinamide-phosphate synthase CbiB n=1 Tax=Leptolyngbya sp. 'hensonii' TaxID=1922337 RepID=UPI00094FC433|nr:adenosylcobinamide-phosphate synthase CbiB [Leptolyngbya sp. 'hensonii']OLP18336.1 cobalamin biosynthesis protein [Leptolyngbya sp. 'hensonii']